MTTEECNKCGTWTALRNADGTPLCAEHGGKDAEELLAEVIAERDDLRRRLRDAEVELSNLRYERCRRDDW